MRFRDQKGFSAAELLVVIVIIGLMALVAIPFLTTFTGPAAARDGARVLQAGLNQARMLAITTRQDVCFQVLVNGYRLLQGGCGGVAWVGAGTDATGRFSSPENVAFASPASPVFTLFGTASQTAVLTATGPSQSTLTVTVLPSGRVTVP